MQSLQADQSLYNRKVVYYISLSYRSFPGDKNTCILIREANILLFYNKLL